MTLGGEGAPTWTVRLEKSEAADNYDSLRVDLEGDGLGDDDLVATCTPTERRDAIWSSFSVYVEIVHHDASGGTVTNPTELSFWYVTTSPDVIRFVPDGWMQGTAETDAGTIHVLLAELTVDGRFDEGDRWSVAEGDAIAPLYTSKASRAIGDFNWAGEQAWMLERVSPDGRTAWLRPHDPGLSRAEDELARDPYGPDRREKHSGESVVFLHDFDEATAQARDLGQPVLLDFETTWCGPCEVMDQMVYTADRVVAAAEGVTAVKLDGDEEKQLVERFEVTGYPTLVLLSAEGDVVARAAGYQSVERLVAMLARAKGDSPAP